MNNRSFSVLATVLLFVLTPAAADEGMWLFNAPPSTQIKAKYGFQLSQPWLDHLRLSSLRFVSAGGSGSFVSGDGLAFTNQHIARSCLAAISSPGHDYMETGYLAKHRSQELLCPGQELDQLLEISDVTGTVNAQVKPGMNDAQAGKLQRAAIAQIEKDCATAANLRCDVVTLYAGAQYHLYKYHRYTDLRLVFAPEFSAAFFGGDPDNFEYPRYDLDISFFRVYENGQPVHVDDYLHWSHDGAKDGDLVFVSGNPGSTGRDDTMNHLYFLRQVRYPFTLAYLKRRIALLEKFSAESPENARIAARQLLSYQNSFKADSGFLDALNDPAVMNRKKGDERRMLVMGTRGPRGREIIPAMLGIDRALEAWRKMWLPLSYLEDRAGFAGDMAGDARILVRAAAQRQLPNSERLPEYRDSSLPRLEQQLFSPAPLHKSLNAVLMEDSLAAMQRELGNNAAVQKVLNGRPPKDVADEAVQQSHLDDLAVRKQLYEGGEKAIEASTDPLIVMMREAEPEAMELRKHYEDEVQSVLRQNYAKMARVRFAFGGASTPPDATFTLRLSYGQVKGYTEDGRGIAPKGTKLVPFTDFEGAFKHSADFGGKFPYDLPESWMKSRKKLRLSTPLNFVSTADIIGGNSGSPVVNQQGELVGVIFDGDIQSLPWNFQYEDVVGRAVSVDCRGVIEALRHIYHADALVKELMKSGKAKIAKQSP